MRRMLLLGIVLQILASVQVARAQFNWMPYYDCSSHSPLTEQCGFTGDILPDGTTNVEIFWDQNNNGPDAADQLARITGDAFGRANYNTFAMNGLEQIGCEGGFLATETFTIASHTPQPSRYWLRICVPGQNRYWRTNSFTVPDGYSERGIMQTEWTCVEQSCTETCEPPPVVEGVEASQGLCQLTITWSDVEGETAYRLYRNGSQRAIVAQDVTGFVDDQAQPNVTYSYTIQSQNGDCQASPSFSAEGNRTAPPNPPTFVTASDTSCGAIYISWTNVSFEEGYRVKRNGVTIATVGSNVTSFVDETPGVFSYRVQAFNPCGASFNSLADTGRTDVAPNMLSLAASSPDCEGISLTYLASANSDTVKLYRDGNLIAQLLTSSGVHEDLPPVSGDYTYSARAIGDCGVSNVIGGVLGTLLEYPAGPTNLSYTNDSCSTIRISWTPATGAFGYYRVLRDAIELATVANTSTYYDDGTVIGGFEYAYAVIAVNDTCGESTAMDSVVASVVLGSLPAAPEVIITTQNLDAVLTWAPVDTTLEGCPIQVSRYLVYFSENGAGPFYYHGSTTETSYRHIEVLRFSPDMFYHVESFVGEVALLARIPENGNWTREEVMARIAARDIKRRDSSLRSE